MNPTIIHEPYHQNLFEAEEPTHACRSYRRGFGSRSLRIGRAIERHSKVLFRDADPRRGITELWYPYLLSHPLPSHPFLFSSPRLLLMKDVCDFPNPKVNSPIVYLVQKLPSVTRTRHDCFDYINFLVTVQTINQLSFLNILQHVQYLHLWTSYGQSLFFQVNECNNYIFYISDCDRKLEAWNIGLQSFRSKDYLKFSWICQQNL